MDDVINNFYQRFAPGLFSEDETAVPSSRPLLTYQDVKRLYGEQLADPFIYHNITVLVSDIIISREYAEALSLSKILEGKLVQLNTVSDIRDHSYKDSYTKLIHSLRFFSIALLPKNDVINIFSHELLSLIISGFDIRERLEWIFVVYEDDISDSALRISLLKALRENQEEIPFPQEEKNVGRKGRLQSNLTISSVMREYDAFAARTANKVRTGVERATFLARNQMINSLSPLMKDAVLKLLEVYDWLLFEKVIPDWVKELETPRKPTLDTEKVLEMKLPAPKAPDRLLATYASWAKDPLVVRVLGKLNEVSMGASLMGEIPAISDAFYRAINVKDVEAVLESLWKLGRAGSVGSALASSDRYKRYWGNQLTKSKSSEEAQEFLNDPTASKHLLAFLRHVLEERLKLPEESAKMVILMLSNECRKAGEEEYAHMAYGDLQTGEFKWNA